MSAEAFAYVAGFSAGAFNVSDIQPDGHTAALILVR